MRVEGAVALVIGAFGLSFVGGMQTSEKPGPAKPAEARSESGLALADALPLPQLGTEAKAPKEPKTRVVKSPRSPRTEVERVKAPAPAPRVTVAPRYVPPVAQAPAPAATPVPTPVPTARATPAPTFDDGGEPTSGDFDYEGGG
jgi:hypothetical protein